MKHSQLHFWYGIRIMVTEGMSVKKMHQTQSRSPKVVCILFIKKNTARNLSVTVWMVSMWHMVYKAHLFKEGVSSIPISVPALARPESCQKLSGRRCQVWNNLRNLSKRLGERVTTIGTINRRCTKWPLITLGLDLHWGWSWENEGAA